MKRVICICSLFICIILMLFGVQKNVTPEHNTDFTSRQWQIIEIEGEEARFMTNAAELYESTGYGWFQCKKTGFYNFYAAGNLYDSYDPGEGLLDWQLFLFEEPFYEKPNGIRLAGERIYSYENSMYDGVYIEEGQYIVVYCSQNVNTYGRDFSGDEMAQFICEWTEYEPRQWQITEIEGEEARFVTNAAELYESTGYGWFRCKKAGFYNFYAAGNLYDSYDPGEGQLDWQLYLLDEPFNDTPSGIPFVAERMMSYEEGVYIEEGQYIVVYCPQNGKTYGLDYAGDETAQFVCEFDSEKER
ncbi:MAG: hypothetical protein NC124_06725 [Clostridium sp.]|nr:hypothetical protein [Clostridium sp.]